MIGTTIGRYRVTGKLGEGGGGSVWRAEDPVLGRHVAIKLLPEHAAGSPEARERLLREARAACSLNHSGIAAVYEAGEDDGRIWVAFEHVDGETVAERVKREGPLPVEEALRIAREATVALDHAHDRGILHRDVTSGNLMIDRDGAVKLVDFGLTLPEESSRRTRDTTQATPGTIGYIAPEIVKGERGDRRADLYGLGVVLYEMLTGHLPFERDRAEAVLYAVVNEEPVAPRTHRPELPAGVEDVVLRAIAKDPAERFADAGELQRAFEGDAPARRVGSGDRRRNARRNALAVLAVAVVAITVWWLRRDDTPRFDSVAVLPLSLPGENAEEIAYLATGLGDALASRLSRVSGLRVTPWVTSRRYPPGSMPAPDLGAELNVESLVVGELREDGGRLRIRLSLLNAGNGESAWSAEFEDARAGLLELQEVVTLALAHGIRGKLTLEEAAALGRSPTDRVEAWDHYLRGAAVLQAGTREANETALAHFETAIAIDPRLAEARVGVGAAHNERYWHGWAGTESVALAEESFLRALEIDADQWPALQGLLQTHWIRGPNEECLRIAADVRRRSAAEGASVEALLTQGLGFTMGGLFDKAVAPLQVACELDPTNQASRFFLVMTRGAVGDPAGAVAAGEEYLQLFGEDPEIHYWLALARRCLGDRQAALAHFERSLELAGEVANIYVHGSTALLHRELANESRALQVARDGIRLLDSRLRNAGENPRLETALIRLHAIAGDTTEVIERGGRLRERSDREWSATPWLLAFAYAEVGRTTEANGLLVDQLERLQRTAGSRTSSESDDTVFLDYWLRNCESGVAGAGIESDAIRRLRDLPVFDELMEALRAEETRRRALYGS